VQIAGYALGGLYRNYFAQTEDSRVRIGPAGPHLLDLVACTVGANSRPMARPLYAAPCHAPQPRQYAQSLRAGPRRTTPSGRLPPTLGRAVNTAQIGGHFAFLTFAVIAVGVW
jgi:hypothetical protein